MYAKTIFLTAAIDKPKVGRTIHGESSLNVTWEPSSKSNPSNPGSDFYVKYRKPGMFANYFTWCEVLIGYDVVLDVHMVHKIVKECYMTLKFSYN